MNTKCGGFQIGDEDDDGESLMKMTIIQWSDHPRNIFIASGGGASPASAFAYTIFRLLAIQNIDKYINA